MNETTEFTGRKDPLYRQAVELIIESKRISPSYVQRRLKISYRRAELLCSAVIESLMAKYSDHIAASGKVITLIAESARQIEEALAKIAFEAPSPVTVEALAAIAFDALPLIRAARTQEQVTIEAAEKMGATGADPTETERQLFEAWMKGHCWAVCGKWDGRQYVGTDAYDDFHPYVMHTRGLWAAWRDRAALAAPQPVKDPVVTDEERMTHAYRRGFIHGQVDMRDRDEFEPIKQDPTEKWIDPNDKNKKQYLPHIGEKVLFCCDGEVYYGHHTGGAFQKGHGVTKSLFPTWDCMWMHLPTAVIAPNGEKNK